jgi:uncharacterized protein (DUF2267 family)
MSNDPQQDANTWTGLGQGISREAFLRKIGDRVVGLGPAEELAEAVFCALSGRLSSGTARDLFEQLSPEVRELFTSCRAHPKRDAGARDKNDFYLDVAEHLDIDEERDARRVLHGVFAALHGQITDGVASQIAAELPSELEATWTAARRVADRPA